MACKYGSILTGLHSDSFSFASQKQRESYEAGHGNICVPLYVDTAEPSAISIDVHPVAVELVILKLCQSHQQYGEQEVKAVGSGSNFENLENYDSRGTERQFSEAEESQERRERLFRQREREKRRDCQEVYLYRRRNALRLCNGFRQGTLCILVHGTS